jgi:hypothetical protein
MIPMIATKPFSYGSRRLLPGDEFEARTARDRKVLIAAKKAKDLDTRVPGRLPPPPQELVDKILGAAPSTLAAPVEPPQTPRDPLDHDGDGRKGGSSTADGDPDELKRLRQDYEAHLGKKPFYGWDAETLRSKIAEATRA